MLLVVRPGAPSSVLAPSSDALVTSSFLLLVVRPGAPSSFLLLVAIELSERETTLAEEFVRTNVLMALRCLAGKRTLFLHDVRSDTPWLRTHCALLFLVFFFKLLLVASCYY